MAAFELRGIGSVGDAAREWRIGRYVPLYIAGILVGIGVGLGVTLWQSSEPSVRPYREPVAVVVAQAEAAPVLPAVAVAPDAGTNVAPVLPAVVLPSFDGAGAA